MYPVSTTADLWAEKAGDNLEKDWAGGIGLQLAAGGGEIRARTRTDDSFSSRERFSRPRREIPSGRHRVHYFRAGRFDTRRLIGERGRDGGDFSRPAAAVSAG